MDCKRALSLEGPYLAGRLTGPTRSQLEAHLGSCLSCARSLKRLKALRSVVRSSFSTQEQAPVGLKENITVCVRCMEDPGRTVCPRLRRKFRLVRNPEDALT
jgi:anti-sigma factor RsiW